MAAITLKMLSPEFDVTSPVEQTIPIGPSVPFDPTVRPASPNLFDPLLQFDPLLRWYRKRPSQVAFAVSIVLHALLVAFVPGLRSVEIEPQRVLTVRIADTEPTIERSVVRQPVVREAAPVPPPVFKPTVPQPRALEQSPVRTQQTPEPQRVPDIRQPQQVEQVARADLVPPIPRDILQPQPVTVVRPDVVPVQPTIPVIKTPVPQIEQPVAPVTELRSQPRPVPQIPNSTLPQARPDAPPPAVQPEQIQEAVVALPAVPPQPQSVAPVVAAPAPQPAVSVVEATALEAYRQSVSAEVMRHMRYPRVAVARKWQGKTIVEIKLSSEGDVMQVSVAQESGYKALDDAAITMVRRSLPLPKPPQGVRTVTVPVVFRLQS